MLALWSTCEGTNAQRNRRLQQRSQNSRQGSQRKGKVVELIQPVMGKEQGRTAIVRRKHLFGNQIPDEFTPSRSFEITSKKENQLILLFVAAVSISLLSLCLVLFVPNETKSIAKKQTHIPNPAPVPITGMLVEIPTSGPSSQQQGAKISNAGQVSDASDDRAQEATEKTDPALDAKILRAVRLIKKQRYRKAMRALRDWLGQYPDCAGFHFHYARALFLVNNRFAKKALKHIERAIELDPFDAEFHNLSAMLYKSLGQRSEAAKSKKVYRFLRNNES